MRTCGWPDARRHRLAALAAVAGGDLEVARDAVDRAQRLEPVAHQRGSAHWRRHPSVLDQVALGHAEHEVAGGRLHLAAAERDRVEAPLHAADQLVRRGVAGREEGVRHPRDRQLPERLAAAVAGGLHAVLARAQQVVQVGGEPALLDHGRAAGGRALVVHALASPGVRPAAVVVGRDELGRQLVAQPARRTRSRPSGRRPPQGRGRPPRGAAHRRSRCRPPPAGAPWAHPPRRAA